jgi:hypothetical protein
MAALIGTYGITIANRILLRASNQLLDPDIFFVVDGRGIDLLPTRGHPLRGLAWLSQFGQVKRK